MEAPQYLVPINQIERRILKIRGIRVILDADMAELYGVSTKVLNQAVRRNRDRFPDDFMFQLRESEKDEVVTNCDHLKNIKYSRQLPYAFTEHGAIMAASILNTRRAVEVSLFVVRAFIRYRQMLGSHSVLAKKIAELEKKYDHHFKIVFDAIRELMEPPPRTKKDRIGFL